MTPDYGASFHDHKRTNCCSCILGRVKWRGGHRRRSPACPACPAPSLRSERVVVHQPFSAVRVSGCDGVAVVTLRGDIDMSVETEVRRALLPASDVDTPRTVIDLSEVSFMDSAGINALINAHLRAGAQDGWIRVVTSSPLLQSLFRTLGIDEVISSYPTLREALQA
ncbi:STAS domain-containing protein [Streptomyces sp. NPDC006134]|uniref:STAS domain-containing protein n=1 Tax=Streptomyces sp. NPDC006134 TaxID=3154467 RepID=UPI00340062A0